MSKSKGTVRTPTVVPGGNVANKIGRHDHFTQDTTRRPSTPSTLTTPCAHVTCYLGARLLDFVQVSGLGSRSRLPELSYVGNYHLRPHPSSCEPRLPSCEVSAKFETPGDGAVAKNVQKEKKTSHSILCHCLPTDTHEGLPKHRQHYRTPVSILIFILHPRNLTAFPKCPSHQSMCQALPSYLHTSLNRYVSGRSGSLTAQTSPRRHSHPWVIRICMPVYRHPG